MAIRTDRMGDVLQVLPSIHALKETFPYSEITTMINHGVSDLIRGNPEIKDIFIYDSINYKGIYGNLKLIFSLRKQHFDMVIIFNPQKKFHIISFLAGIKKRIGYDRKLGFLLTHKIKDLKYLGLKHEIEYNLDLVRLIGADTKDKSIILYPDESCKERIENLFKEFNLKKDDTIIALHPWTSNPEKKWPLENFKTLIDKILEENLGKIVIIGGKEEKQESQDFCLNFGQKIINFTDKLTLKELVYFFKYVKVLVTNDSGPMHIASGVSVSTVALFRLKPEGVGPKRWGPQGEKHIVLAKESIFDIKVEEVFSAIKKILKR
ncbi:MAG: glycosyltransferase family 9 protein [Candidatus Omnitrophota bacterium]